MPLEVEEIGKGTPTLPDPQDGPLSSVSRVGRFAVWPHAGLRMAARALYPDAQRGDCLLGPKMDLEDRPLICGEFKEKNGRVTGDILITTRPAVQFDFRLIGDDEVLLLFACAVSRAASLGEFLDHLGRGRGL